jgi:outer membrane protein OmpA-like peptidoglycan-associated protein
MKPLRFPLAAIVAVPLVLGACTDPGMLNDPNNPNRNRDSGVLLGAGIGAVLGNLIGDDTEATVAGAVIGGVAGGVIGNNLDKQEADLRRDLGNDNVMINNTGDRLIVTLPQDILFATDSFAVRSDLQRDLRTVAGNLLAYPDTTVQVVGHTDNVGDALYNLELSQRRAASVAGVLIDAGVPPRRINAIGQGEDQPIASNLSPEGRALNRRVEIVILPNT